MTDATFGRKRRARRARGRRIEARRWIRGRGHWVRFDIDANRPTLLELARKIHVPVFDEIDRFPVMTDEQAQAYLNSHRDQRAAARSFHSTPDGSGILTVEQWAAARRTISRQQESPTNH